MKNFFKSIIVLLFIATPMHAQEIISFENALKVYNTKNLEQAKAVLAQQGYTYKGVTKERKHIWCKFCDLSGTTPCGFAKRSCSIVEYKLTGDIVLSVRVFNKKYTEDFWNQLETAGYKWQGTGSGIGAVQWQKNLNNPNETPHIYLIGEADGYAYFEHGGYFLIIGGEL